MFPISFYCFQTMILFQILRLKLSVPNVQLLFPKYFSKLHVTELFPFIRTKWYITCENTGKKSDKNVQVKTSLNMRKWEWSSISEIISRMRRRNLIFRGNFSDFHFPSDFTAKITKYFVPVRWISWLHPNWISRRLSGNMKIETYATANYINLITFYNV